MIVINLNCKQVLLKTRMFLQTLAKHHRYLSLKSSPINSFFLGSTKLKKHRDKYAVDYEYFSNIPLNERDDELDRINSLKKVNTYFAKEIPFFPNKEIWDYHGTKLMTHTW
jgi:hypothetical protein